jgi:uncharacterized protein
VPVPIHTAGIGPYLTGFPSAAGSPLLLEGRAGPPSEAAAVRREHRVSLSGRDGRDDDPVSAAPRGCVDHQLGAPARGVLRLPEALVRAGLRERVMFGSDQVRWPEKIGEGIDAIEQVPFLTKDQKRDILYQNAVRFLRLEEDASGARPSQEEAPWQP